MITAYLRLQDRASARAKCIVLKVLETGYRVSKDCRPQNYSSVDKINSIAVV